MDDNNLGHRMISYVLLFVELLVLNVKMLVEICMSIFRIFVPPEEVSVIGEKVLITGTGHGIGKELARQYGELGAEIICVDVNPQTNQETVNELRKLGIKAVGFEYDLIPVCSLVSPQTKTITNCFKPEFKRAAKEMAFVLISRCDVSKRENVLELYRKVKNEVGDITILVNNAGIMPTKKWKDQIPNDVLRIFEINVFAHFWIFEAFLPAMIQKNHGHVVGISSVAGLIGFPYVAPYCGSKYAVRGIMEAMAEEFRAEGKAIKFTTIFPYMTNTGLCKKVKIRFQSMFNIQDTKYVASQIIKAQRRGYREAMIPGYMKPLHDYGRLLPEKSQMDLIDFVDTGLCVE